MDWMGTVGTLLAIAFGLLFHGGLVVYPALKGERHPLDEPGTFEVEAHPACARCQLRRSQAKRDAEALLVLGGLAAVVVVLVLVSRWAWG